MMRLARGFGAPEPPLLRAAYLQLGSDQSGRSRPDRLLLAVTPLCADAAAVSILVEDLGAAYRQAAQASDTPLLSPTATFANWMQRWAEYGQSSELEAQRAYWQAACQELPPWPTGAFRGADAGASRVVTARLATETTRQLQELDAYSAPPEQVILAALAQVLTRWTGHTALLVRVSDYQRGSDRGGLDTSRLVGALQVDYPLRLDAPLTDDQGALFKAVKEQARQAAQHGPSYGFLREADAGWAMQPPAAFTYCPPPPENSLFRVVDVRAPSLADRAQDLVHLRASMVNGQLQLDWRCTGELSQDTMSRLCNDLVGALQSLIQHCRESGNVQFTPSDFPEAGLDQQALDQLIARLGKKA
jgi:non-ribosomal peptide synthase protein (TIGR01720 family)